MMQASEFLSATDEQRSMILSQADARLLDQHAFAGAADTRAAIVTGVAAALASAGAGLFAAGLDGSANLPLIVGGSAAALGFGYSARAALHSARCLEFHPRGYLPSNFRDDIIAKKPANETFAEMAEDFEERLAFNRKVLVQRGKLMDRAMDWMWRTPLIAAGLSALTWTIEALAGSTSAVS